MDAEEAADTLMAATQLRAKLTELELRIAVHADTVRVGDEVAASSTANWWANQTRQDRPVTFKLMLLAQALETDLFVPLRVGFASGELNVEQAHVIRRAIDDLPDDLDPVLTGTAVSLLVAEAGHLAPRELRILGKGILATLAPDVADAVLEKKLAKEEREAAAAARFTMTKDGHGKVHGRFTLSALHGAMLEKALLALAAPKHRAAVDGHLGPRRPSPERMGKAFTEYLEGYPTSKLPKAGGLAATVVVTIPLETLMGGLKAASLDTGGLLSPGAARRLACQARIIPMVLGGDSVVLDVGRTYRWHNDPMRVAIGVRDGGCTADGCDWSPGLCHVHHKVPWHQGGGTSVKDGQLLCPHHHARAHDPTYTMSDLPGGKVTFTRRQ